MASSFRRYVGTFPVVYPDSKDIILPNLGIEKMMTSVAFLNSEQKTRPIHEVMNFGGLVFLDCGIFQRGTYKKNFTWTEISEHREKLIQWYAHLKPDIASSLDLPSPLGLEKELKKERLIWSIENYKLMKTQLDTPLSLGLSLLSNMEIRFSKMQIQKILAGHPELLGLGGLVPLMRASETNYELGRLILHLIHEVHKNFSNSLIHVYGLGDHKWYPLIRLLGASSSDYSGYHYITGRGGILLPGSSEKYLLRIIKHKKKNGYAYYTRPDDKIFSKEELRKLYGCHCPSCTDIDPAFLEFDRDRRLVHNLYVILEECKLVDEFIWNSDVEGLRKHIEEVFRDNHMKLFAQYALKLLRRYNSP